MEAADILNKLRERLQQPLPGLSAQERMAARVVPMPNEVPANARASAVLVLLFHFQEELNVLLMKRMEDKGAHSGQVSFPGGRQEQYDADLRATALREAQEEVGILSAEVDILGGLTPLYIPVSNFNVYPYVGYAKERPQYNLSKQEVAYVMEVPLSTLLHESRKTVTDVVSPAVPGVIRQVKAYELEDGTIIWGATAMIISELEVLLQELI
ncbi:MAG: CoA pyrophosphatase [Bacteroidetes bacterium]|nr:CoA pyrophosphatase [Bacteroidota bacterium]